MSKLIQSPVVFNELEHTYTLDGRELSGITSIIKRFVFPDMYSCVSQDVLNKAAERGSIVHKNIEMWANGILGKDAMPQLQPFFDAVDESGILYNQAEYLVSDCDIVASCIDLVGVDTDGHIILADIKTTAVLNIEYLRWQLSIYAYLFEHQNPGVPVYGLRAIHIRDGKCRIVDIERLPDEYVLALLDAYRNDADHFDNPLHVVPEDLNELLQAYADNEAELQLIEANKAPYDQRKKELAEAITNTMREKKLSKLESPIAKVTISKDSERQTFDLKAFQESETYTSNRDLYNAFIKKSTSKGRTTITLQ